MRKVCPRFCLFDGRIVKGKYCFRLKAVDPSVLKRFKEEKGKLVEENFKLNQMLSKYQSIIQAQKLQESSTIQPLPLKGPRPIWLVRFVRKLCETSMKTSVKCFFFRFQVEKKFLSPLIAAYEEQLREKDEIILQIQVDRTFRGLDSSFFSAPFAKIIFDLH